MYKGTPQISATKVCIPVNLTIFLSNPAGNTKKKVKITTKKNTHVVAIAIPGAPKRGARVQSKKRFNKTPKIFIKISLPRSCPARR
jgi:hypothetical protein